METKTLFVQCVAIMSGNVSRNQTKAAELTSKLQAEKHLAQGRIHTNREELDKLVEIAPETRDWRDEHVEMIADAIASILTRAFPAYAIPPKLRFSYERIPALDVEILDVFCSFEIASLLFFLNFELDTGKGSTYLDRKSSVEGVSLTCEKMGDDLETTFKATWNSETAKWDKPLSSGQRTADKRTMTSREIAAAIVLFAKLGSDAFTSSFLTSSFRPASL